MWSEQIPKVVLLILISKKLITILLEVGLLVLTQRVTGLVAHLIITGSRMVPTAIALTFRPHNPVRLFRACINGTSSWEAKLSYKTRQHTFKRKSWNSKKKSSNCAPTWEISSTRRKTKSSAWVSKTRLLVREVSVLKETRSVVNMSRSRMANLLMLTQHSALKAKRQVLVERKGPAISEECHLKNRSKASEMSLIFINSIKTYS